MGAECPARGTVTDIYIYHIRQRLAPLLFFVSGGGGDFRSGRECRGVPRVEKIFIFSAKVLKINLLLS